MAETKTITNLECSLSEEGLPTCIIKHSITQTVDESGRVIASAPLREPLAGDEPEAKALLGSLGAKAAAQVNQLQSQLDAMAAERDALKTKLGKVQAQAETQAARLEKLTAAPRSEAPTPPPEAPSMGWRTLLDPRTKTGTAFWVALGLTGYDVFRNGLNLANGAVFLVLAGVDIAARYFANAQPPAPPTQPPLAPA